MAKEKQEKKNPTIFRYFISKAFWFNIIIACASLFLVFSLALIFIKQYSQHGESQTVPNIMGLTIAEAEEQLNSLNLDYAVMDSSYDPEEKPLSILNQDPAPDSKVKSGRKIYITVNMAQPPQTEVPNIELGTSYISVREILESKGLRIGEVIYKPFEYKDVFLDMHLKGESKTLQPGSKIPKGSKIDLVLGNGLGDTKVDLPDFTMLTYMEAVTLIQLKELSLGTVIATGTITDSTNAFVYRQDPAYEDGRQINLGSMVDIWISEEMITPDEGVDEE